MTPLAGLLFGVPVLASLGLIDVSADGILALVCSLTASVMPTGSPDSSSSFSWIVKKSFIRILVLAYRAKHKGLLITLAYYA